MKVSLEIMTMLTYSATLLIFMTSIGYAIAASIDPKSASKQVKSTVISSDLPPKIRKTLEKIKDEINKEYGFREGVPRINCGPCGVFAQVFF